MANSIKLFSLYQRSLSKQFHESLNFHNQIRAVTYSLQHTGQLEEPKTKTEPYETGQVFLHNAFKYRGVILYPWKVKVHKQNKSNNAITPDMNSEEMAARICKHPKSSNISEEYFYTILMDKRDINPTNKAIQFNTMSFLHEDTQGINYVMQGSEPLKSEPYLDYAFHDDICPYTSVENIAINHSRYLDLIVDENSEQAREKFRSHQWIQLKDVYTHTKNNIRVTVMPLYLGCVKKSIDDPEKRKYCWRYHTRIENLNDETVTVRKRKWFTTALWDDSQVYTGTGVVGIQPRLTPENNIFQYSSHIILESHKGYMWGSFTLERDDGTQFDCVIPQFNLDSKFLNNSDIDITGDKT